MKLTPRCIINVFITMLLINTLTACDAGNTKTIPAVNEKTITEAAETFDISIEKFESYLNNLNISYDDYINSLNSQNQTLDDYKTKIEEGYDCTFEQYVDTVLVVNNKEIPDENTYTLLKSKYSLFDAYIPSDELNADKNSLVNYDIDISVADDDENVYAFDILAYCESDLRMYMDALNQKFDCKSIEITNISIFGGHGSIKPDGTNPCMDSLFVYDDKTNEILEPVILAVITMHYDNADDDITYALSNELGLIFKTSGSDSLEKMTKLDSLDIQIRKADTTTDNEASTTNV